MNKIKVLLVEDEMTLAMIIKDTLGSKGFDVSIAHNGEEGLSMMPLVKPDVIVSDIMMPVMDGFEMVRRIRRTNKRIPVLFLTARSAVEDVVEGFEQGGNDYLRKPFGIDELMVRIRSLVSRFGDGNETAQENDTKIAIGLFTLDTVTQMLSFCGEEGEELSNRESELLKYLATKRNEVVEISDILMKLWGNDSPFNARSLHVFIHKLRNKLSRDENVKILNIRGIGYKLVAS